MKNPLHSCRLLLTLLITLVSSIASTTLAQATYTWVATSGSADWTLAASWSPNRTTPAIDDILQFNGGGNSIAINVPAQAIGKLQVSTSTIINLQAGAAANILTINTVAVDSLTVDATSQLNVNGASALIVALVPGAVGGVSGSMDFSSAANVLIATNAGAPAGITFGSGATFTQDTGNTGNVFGGSGALTTNGVIFGSGSTFIQKAGTNPFATAFPNAVVVFQPGSLFSMQQNAAPSFSGRTYGNLQINATGFSQSGTGGNTLAIDNLIMTLGTLNLNLTGGININSNISVITGQTLSFTPATANIVTFAGSTISGGGTLSVGPNATFNMSNPVSITGGTLVENGKITGGSLTVSGVAMQFSPFNVTTSSTNSIALSGTLTYGASPGTVSISALPALASYPYQISLIRYGSASGTYNLSLGTMPSGFSGNLINNIGNNSVDLQVTGGPALSAGNWTGGGTPDGNWQTAANWLAGSVPTTANSTNTILVFGGTQQLLTTNNFASGTTFGGIGFASGSGAFTLNGNAVSLTNNVFNTTVLDTSGEGDISNASASAQTLLAPLTIAQGRHTLSISSSGGLNINGAVTRNTGATVFFTNSSSGVFNLSGAGLAHNNGIIGAWAINNNDWAATNNLGNVVAYSGYTDVPAAGGAITGTTVATNLRETNSTANLTAANGTTINSYLFADTNGTAARTLTVTGVMRFGSRGGVYRNATLNNTNFTITGGNLTTAGSGGEITLSDGPLTATANSLTVNSVITNDNGNAPVTLNIMGYVALGAANTYSGGTYINQGRVQGGTSVSVFGSGPVYVLPGGEAFLNTSGNFANNFFVSGIGTTETSGGQNLGAVRFGSGANISGTLTLLANTRVSGVSGLSNIISGKITGPGQLELIASTGNTVALILSNPNNDWQGGLLITSASGRGLTNKLGASNVIPDGAAAGNVTLNGNTTAVGFDLNSFNETINGLISAGTAALDVVDNGSNTTSATLTLGGNNATATFAGIIQNSGAGATLGIAKIGSGKQTFSGTDTYTGITAVGQGTLAVTGSGSVASSSQIIITNGGTLDISQAGLNLAAGKILGGNGVVTGAVAAASSSIIDSGLAGVGTLSISNSTFTLNGNAANGVTNKFNLSSGVPTGPNSSISVGTLAYNGTNTIFISGFSSLASGTYTLIQYGSESVGTGAKFVLVGFAASGRQTANLVDTGTEVDLVIGGAAANVSWTGADATNPTRWDNLQSDTNWVTADVGQADTNHFYDNDLATFDDVANNNSQYSVVVSGTVSPGTTTIANNTADSAPYVFSGTGKISGLGRLAKIGSGTLALFESGGDNFSGGILAGGGSLVLSNSSVAISGGLTVTNGTLVLAHSGTISGGLNMNNTAGGSPSALIAGSGTLSGGTTVSAGVLNISNSAIVLGTLAQSGGNVSIAGSATVGPVSMTSGALVVSGTPAISSGLTINGGGALLDQATTPTGNTTIANTASLSVGNNDIGLGNLPSGTISDNGTLILNRGDDITIANTISGSGTLLKADTNNVTVGGVNSSYNGNIVLTNGFLKVTAATGLGSGVGSVTVTNAGTFDMNAVSLNAAAVKVFVVSGTGYTNGGAIVNSGAQLTAGLSNVVMVGDTSLGGLGDWRVATTGRWDIRAKTAPAATLSTGGHPYKLTKVGNNQVSIVSVQVDPQLGDVDVQGGQLGFEAATTGLGNSASNLFIRAGATIELFQATNALNKVITIFGDGVNTNVFWNSSGGGITNVIVGPITLTGSGDAVFGGAFPGTVSNVISGANGLIINGPKPFLASTNSYTGNTTIKVGTLSLVGIGSISNSAVVTIAGGAVLDASGRTDSTFWLNSSQTLSNSSSTAMLSGSAQTALGTVSLTYASGTPSIITTNGTFTLSASTVFNVNNTGTALAPGSYKLISKATTGNVGLVAGTVPASVTVNGGGIAAGAAASLQINNGELFLAVVGTPVFSGLTANQSITYGTPSVTLGGTISAPGPFYPASGETITVTINGNPQTTTISDPMGDFTINYSTSALPYSAVPYTITYSYAGDTSFTSASDSSTVMTVNQLVVSLAGTRAFDGTTNASAAILSVVNRVGLDDVSVASGVGGLAGAGVGSQAITSVGSLALGGLTAPNYTLVGAGGSVIVTQALTSVVVGSSENPSGFNDSITFNATLPVLATGGVTFKTNAVLYDTEALTGGAATSVATSALPRGITSVTVEYAGDVNYIGSTNSINQSVTNHPPTIANIVTNSVITGSLWQISVLSLSNSAAWADVDGDSITLSSVGPLSANSVSVTNDSTSIYYTAPVTTEDHFTYVITDGTDTATGTVYLEAVAPPTPATATNIVVSAGVPTIKFVGTPNSTNVVQQTTNLLNSWVSFSTNVADGSGFWQVTDTDATNYPLGRFYRSFQPLP